MQQSLSQSSASSRYPILSSPHHHHAFALYSDSDCLTDFADFDHDPQGDSIAHRETGPRHVLEHQPHGHHASKYLEQI